MSSTESQEQAGASTFWDRSALRSRHPTGLKASPLVSYDPMEYVAARLTADLPGFGGPPACWLVAEHFERFLVGQGKSKCNDLKHPSLIPSRSAEHKSPVRANVPWLHVLREERPPGRCNIGD